MKKNKKSAKIIILLMLFAVVTVLYNKVNNNIVKKLTEVQVPQYVDVQYITGPSRNRLMLSDVKNIVIHYVGNPNTTAQNNREYFNNPTTNVNSHFIIGLEGEIIECIPLYERSSASNNRNKDTISIEVCHPDEDGKFNEETYKSVVKLTAWLCKICRLNEKDVIRHYDITGKLCPIYYVNNQDAWDNLLKDVKTELKKLK